MRLSEKLIRGVVLALVLTFMVGGTALAQDTKVFTDEAKKDEADKVAEDIGWSPWLSVGGTLAFTSNKRVAGMQPLNGTLFNAGWNLDTGIAYVKELHDWRNRLAWVGLFTKTNDEDDNTNDAEALSDNFDLETIYYLRLSDVLGPFARFAWNTHLLKSDAGDPLDPSYLKGALGAFYRPISSKPFSLELRAGLGYFGTIIKHTDDVHMLGAGAGIFANGVISEGRVTYSAFAEALFPFYIDPEPEDYQAVDSMVYEAGAKLSFKLVEWASLDYQLKILKTPLDEKDKPQIQNALLLTIGWTFIDSKVK